MAPKILKRLVSGPTPFILLLVPLLVSLHLLSNATQNLSQGRPLYTLMLAINGIGLVLLLALIGANIRRIVRQYRRDRAGSRLTLRMVALFVMLAVAPVAVVYYYSLQFLHQGIDSWFDVQVDAAMDDALELSRASLDMQMRIRLRQTERMMEEVYRLSESEATLGLGEQRARYGASELVVLSTTGQPLASSAAGSTLSVPELPGDDILLQLRQGSNYVGLDPLPNGGLHIRVVVAPQGGGPILLQALFPLPERISRLAQAVEDAYGRYNELGYLRQALKHSFTLTLTLVLLFSLLAAVWAAIFSARRLTAPIADLVEGTRAVADGNYQKQLTLGRKDELGFLVSSFNDMTRRIASSRRQVEEQRAYLETVLGNLSSGVLSFDAQLRLRTWNPAAARILGVRLAELERASMDEIVSREPNLETFIGLLRQHCGGQAGPWEAEVGLLSEATPKTLLCRGTPLAAGAGQVVVFDDVTTLIQAQRDAAWGEVARRLAHEIKNPLTPIRLSAERLRHKYLHRMEGPDAEVLERATTTIINQVDAMKDMVNAFSDYARPPRMAPELVDVTTLLNEVLDLYRNNDVGAVIELRMECWTEPLLADRNRLRQVFNNLVANALEAMHDQPDPRLEVVGRCRQDGKRRTLELSFSDNGPGFPEELRGKAFEPYITTKARGTGLGLAIVKKIIEEHGGIIQLENGPEGGGVVRLRLPAGLAAAPSNEQLIRNTP